MRGLIFLLLTSLVIVGCENLPADFNVSNWGQAEPVNNVTFNITLNESVNISVATTMPKNPVYFIAKGTVVVIKNDTAVVIDSTNQDAVSIIRDKGAKPTAVIVTNEKRSSGIKYVVLATKPKKVYDNGIDTSNREAYLRYAETLNITSETVNRKKTIAMPDMDVEIFVPFEKGGFKPLEDLNSLAVRVDNLLYMSDCYGSCQNSVDAKAKHLVLANNGHCPTNTVDFMLKIDAEIVYGEEICSSVLDSALLDNVDELEKLGIKFKKMEGIVGVEE